MTVNCVNSNKLAVILLALFAKLVSCDESLAVGQDAKLSLADRQHLSINIRPYASSDASSQLSSINLSRANNLKYQQSSLTSGNKHSLPTSDNHDGHEDNDLNESRLAANGFQLEQTTVHLSQQQQQQDGKELLTETSARSACSLARGCQRKDRLASTYLENCNRYKVENLLSNSLLGSLMHSDERECEKILAEFMRIDKLIGELNELFKSILYRYNCHNGYSVKWNCDECKRAYTDWLCSINLPFYMRGKHVKPCISFCERVEQRCPYLHPIVGEQYGGQPVFICKDPNIPFVPSITPNIPYSEPTKCYDLCHLNATSSELINDSLSKYDHNKCPGQMAIYENVDELDDSPTCDSSTSHHQHLLHSTSAGAISPDAELHVKVLAELEGMLYAYRHPETVKGIDVHSLHHR